MSCATMAGRSSSQYSSKSARRAPWAASETSCPGRWSETPKPRRSNTNTLKRSASRGATRRHDHDDHGVPCTITTGGPSPSLSHAISPSSVAKRSRRTHSPTDRTLPRRIPDQDQAAVSGNVETSATAPGRRSACRCNRLERAEFGSALLRWPPTCRLALRPVSVVVACPRFSSFGDLRCEPRSNCGSA